MITALASFVVIIAGVKIISTLIAPILMGIFSSILLAPAVNLLVSYKIPRALSAFIVVCSVVLILATGIDLVASYSRNFGADMNVLLNKLTSNQKLSDVPMDTLKSIVSGLNLQNLVASSFAFLGTVKQSLTFAFIFFITTFLTLSEGDQWKTKLIKILGSETIGAKIVTSMRKYMFVKIGTSAGTGIIIALSLFLFTDHKYWLLWGIIAAILNFIPNIGSIIAAIPAILFALTMGIGPTITTVIIFLIVNLVIGGYIEQRVIGDQLGISTLVVCLSMLFFGWLLGIVGMLLSVPIVVFTKLVLDELNPNCKISAILQR